MFNSKGMLLQFGDSLVFADGHRRKDSVQCAGVGLKGRHCSISVRQQFSIFTRVVEAHVFPLKID